jgi:hypothetical protein
MFPRVRMTQSLIEVFTVRCRIISDEQSKQAYEVLQIPKSYHPFINGPNGERVKKLTAEHPNVRVNIPPPSVMKDELSVAGEKDGVNKVVEQIQKIFKEMVSELLENWGRYSDW